MRERILKEALTLFKKDRAILLNWATGLGKTRASLKLVDENRKVIVLCQELSHIENWRKELKEHGLEFNIEFHTYASMHKIKGKDYDLILDESHWCLSELRLKKLSKLNYHGVVLLSASMTDDDILKIKTVIPKLKMHQVTLQEAIDAGVLPTPVIRILELELDNKIKQCVYFKTRGKKGKVFNCTYGTYFKTLTLARKNTNYIIVCACTELQRYQILEAEAKSLKQQAFRNNNLWKIYNFKKLEMKRFLAHRKTIHCEQAIKDLRKTSNRFIVFTNGIAQAKQMNPECIHSGNSNKINQSIIDEFNKKTTNELITVKMLRESINLVDIDVGLVVQIDNKKRSPIQMIGRILRGKNPYIYLLTYVNTIDDGYIRDHLKDLRHERISTKHNTF